MRSSPGSREAGQSRRRASRCMWDWTRFGPVTAEYANDHVIHQEWCSVPREPRRRRFAGARSRVASGGGGNHSSPHTGDLRDDGMNTASHLPFSA